jgi:hypothetical protein
MAVTFVEGGRERILQTAFTLAGVDRDDKAEAQLDALVSMAAAICGREHISSDMEGTLAALLCRQLTGQGDRAVSSVKRGDTTITYASDSQTASADLTRTLAPFIHLRSPGAPKGRCC